MISKILFLILFTIEYQFVCGYQSEYTIELKAIKEHILEEKDSILISNINISFSPNGRYFLINSNSSPNEVFIYNTNDYKILKILNAKDSFSDSVIALRNPYFNNQIYLPMIYASSCGMFVKEKLNDFNYGIFVNDTNIFINSTIRTFTIPSNQSYENYKQIYQFMNTCLIKYNFFSDSYQLLLSDDTLNRPINQGENMAYDSINKIIYSVVLGEQAIIDTNARPALISSYYDNYSFNEIIFDLPEEYVKTKILYSLNFIPELIISDKNELIAVLPFVERVFNVTTKESFDIVNLNNTNKKLFESIINNEKALKDYKDTIFNLLPVYVSKIYQLEDGNFMLYIVETNNNKTKKVSPIIQIYSSMGKFITSLNLDYLNKNGKLKYFHYSNVDKKIRMFRLNDENWIVEEYEWTLK